MEEKEPIEKIKPELEKVMDFFKRELAKIRVGRALPSLVEDIPVDFLGEKLKIKELGTIFCPNRNQIVIQPWDKSCLEAIQGAILSSSLGVSPIVEKDKIRLSLPPLSLQQRKDLLKVSTEKKEVAKRTIRRWRDEAWKEIQENFREGEVSEDEKYRKKKELQELIDEYNEKLDDSEERKKKEILE